MKYQDLTYKIIGCAMEVHKHLGSGFQEVYNYCDVQNVYMKCRTFFLKMIDSLHLCYMFGEHMFYYHVHTDIVEHKHGAVK